MVIYYVENALRRAIRKAAEERTWYNTEDQNRAVELLERGVFGDISLAAIQGPPGTGKTSVVEKFASKALTDIIVGEERILLIYVAPTNHLVYETYERIATELVRKGIDMQTVLRSMRIYGSKIRPFSRPRSVWHFGSEIIDEHLLRGCMGLVDPDEVRVVFTTEFQRVAGRIPKGKFDRIHIIADEASKTPYFRVFLPLADRLARHPEEYPESMLVLGDPQQAITVPEEFKELRVPLLMNHVKGVLRRYGLIDERWRMLTLSFRLPSPSHEPISHGFYEGQLNALYTASERMQIMRDIVQDELNNIIQELRNRGLLLDSAMERELISAVETAFSSEIPILLINTRRFRPGDTFEEERVKVSFILSALLQGIASRCPEPVSVAVTAPYNDLVGTLAYRFRKRGLARSIGMPKAITVQAMLGGEADAIITMLGKEWTIEDLYHSTALPLRARLVIDYYETLYPREPEVLNVQLSRHRVFLAVIGNLNRLRWMKIRRDERISRTVYHLLQMGEEERAVYVDLRGSR